MAGRARRRAGAETWQIRRVQQPDQDGFFYSPGVTEPATIGPHDVPPHAGQVVRRVLLRRNIVIDAETAQLVAVAVQAGAPSRPPRRARHVPTADCEPLF
jgi:hypothetical protein